MRKFEFLQNPKYPRGINLTPHKGVLKKVQIFYRLPVLDMEEL